MPLARRKRILVIVSLFQVECHWGLRRSWACVALVCVRPMGEARVHMKIQVGPGRGCLVEVVDLVLVGMVMWVVSDVEGCLGYGGLVFWTLRNLVASRGVRLAVSSMDEDLYI